MTKFSVIIPTYNAEEYIEKCLLSVIKQTYNNFEIIIVDDCSKDKTVEKITQIIHENNEFEIKLFINDINRGVSHTRNRAINESVGEYIVILDSDDYFLNKRLEILNNYLLQYNADFLFDNLLYFYDGGLHFNDAYSIKNLNIREITELKIEEFVLLDLGYLKGVIRRDLLLEYNIFYNMDISVGEDFLFYIKILMVNAKGFLIPQGLYMYRQREGSLSNTANKENYTDRIYSTKKIIEYISGSPNSNERLMKLLNQRLKLQSEQYNFFILSDSIKKKKYIFSFLFMIKNPCLVKKLIVILLQRRKK